MSGECRGKQGRTLVDTEASTRLDLVDPSVAGELPFSLEGRAGIDEVDAGMPGQRLGRVGDAMSIQVAR